MNNNQKFLAGLILGAAAGTALALFLQTDKGKQMLSDIKDAINDAGDTIQSRAQDMEQQLDSLLQKAKQFVADLETKVNEATS